MESKSFDIRAFGGANNPLREAPVTELSRDRRTRPSEYKQPVLDQKTAGGGKYKNKNYALLVKRNARRCGRTQFNIGV